MMRARTLIGLAVAIAATIFWISAQAQVQDRVAGPPALAAGSGTMPLQVLYMFPGVSDSVINSGIGGVDNTGVATSIQCTSFSSIPEVLQVAVLQWDGTVLANVPFTIAGSRTATFSTHLTAVYNEDVNLATGLVNQGVMVVFATSLNIICTAMQVDAAAFVPSGIALHGIRFNPWPGGQE